MNWQKGFARAWMVLSALWVGFVIWLFWKGCFTFPDARTSPICNASPFSSDPPIAGYLEMFNVYDWGAWSFLMAGPPTIALLAWMIVRWIANGFKAQPLR